MIRSKAIFVLLFILISCQQEELSQDQEPKVKSDTVRTIKLFSSNKFLDKNIRSLSLYFGGKTQTESNEFGELERKTSWFRYSAFLGNAFDDFLQSSGDSLFAMRQILQKDSQQVNTPVVAIGRVSDFLPINAMLGDHHHFFLLGNEDIDELPVLTALNDENRDLFLQTMTNYFRTEWKDVLGINLATSNKHRLDKIRNALPPLLGILAMCNYEVLSMERLVLRSTGRIHPRSDDSFLGDIPGFSITYRIPEDSVLKEVYYFNVEMAAKTNSGVQKFISSLKTNITYWGKLPEELFSQEIITGIISQSDAVIGKHKWSELDSLSEDFRTKFIFAKESEAERNNQLRTEVRAWPFVQWPEDQLTIYLK